jgi:tripartite-type tricarboxylate transporter receptor subunit TctC
MSRTILTPLLAVVAIATAPLTAGAQSAYPDKAVRIVSGFPPGTTADVIARVLAPKMAETLGQQVVIENRPGAGSSIAAESVARAVPDGHTLLMATIANTINPALYRLSFDFGRDLAPVMRIAELPGLLVAYPVAAQSLQQLVAAARAKPGDFSFGSSGNGTVTHLYGELFGLATGGKLTHVPYKGSSQAITDLLAGRIGLLFSPASTVIPHVKAGTLKALGAIGPHRTAALPDVPTFAEAGVTGFESSLWFGLMAPVGTAPAIIVRLDQSVQRAMAGADVKSQFTGQGIEPAILRTEAFGAFIRQDTEKWARVVKAAGIKVD